MQKKKNLTIKEMDGSDRPRERMLEMGKKQMSNSELLAILIGSGTVGTSAVDLSKEILLSVGGNLGELSKMTPQDLMRFKGIGEAKGVTLSAALELGRRLVQEQSLRNDAVIRDSGDLYRYIQSKIIDLPHEEFWAVFFNNRNKIMGCRRISSGGITDTAVDIRILFKSALESNAVSIAVAHNHPSGNLKPSQQDNMLTKKIDDAGKTLNIRLLDHVIVGVGPDGAPDYYSYRDNGRL